MQLPMITAQTFAGGDDQGENEKAGKRQNLIKWFYDGLTNWMLSSKTPPKTFLKKSLFPGTILTSSLELKLVGLYIILNII